jgi:hypothetical protein
MTRIWDTTAQRHPTRTGEVITSVIAVGLIGISLWAFMPKGNPLVGDNRSLAAKTLISLGNGLPSMTETKNQVEQYWKTIEALRSEGTLTQEEIREQGFNIKPKIPPHLSSKEKDYERQDQINTQTMIEAKPPTKKGMFFKGIEHSTTITTPNSEKYHFQLDKVSKSHMLAQAQNLPPSSSAKIVKEKLGKPSKETFTTVDGSKDMCKVFIYNLKTYRQGVSTLGKDENLIVQFDQNNMLASIFTSSKDKPPFTEIQ